MLVQSAITSGRDSTRDAAVCRIVKNEVRSMVQSESSCLVKEKNESLEQEEKYK